MAFSTVGRDSSESTECHSVLPGKSAELKSCIYCVLIENTYASRETLPPQKKNETKQKNY